MAGRRDACRDRADLVKAIKADLSVDWADRENTQAALRSKIRRLLRKREYRDAILAATASAAPQFNGGIDDIAQRVFDQAKSLYRYWPDVETGQLFEHR